MINVKPTDKHVENIKKYKKWFEKWDMWDFAYKDKNNYYFLVLYEVPIKGISGYVFLDEKGEIVSFQEAVKYGTSLINFNTNMDEQIKKTLPQMKKNPAAFQALLLRNEK